MVVNDMSTAELGCSTIRTIDIEMEALSALRRALAEPELGRAVERVIHAFATTKGRVIVTGMGKSGHVARKIAATMRSTGTSALFLHPGEASHGDLGVIGPGDVVLAFTWSGETKELEDIYHYCHKAEIPLFVATSRANSTGARAANVPLILPLVREACPNSLAPTSSSTVQLVLGDALAVALIEARGFTPSDFRNFHPGGKLGAQLSTVGDIMGRGAAIPRVGIGASLSAATIEMNRKRYGCTAVEDSSGKLVGAFTDGDLRRCIPVYPLTDLIDQHMSPRPVTATAGTLCSKALELMNDNAVSVLFVTEAEALVGIVHIHDIVKLGIERG